MVKHLCEICGKDFSDDNLGDAREHEKIPVKEGDYHGVIVKDSFPISHYRLLIKSDNVSEEHERIYDSFSIYTDNSEKGRPFKSAEGYELDLIGRLIEEGGWHGLKDRELRSLTNLLDKYNPWRKYQGRKVEKYKTI